MKRTWHIYEVSILKDPVPGWNHDPEDFAQYLQKHLEDAIAHYSPIVEHKETRSH